jgi:prephenate dehydrogenase
LTGDQLGIAGLGLIGGSIALRARAAIAGIRITGFDRDRQTVAAALDRGIIDAPAADLAALAARSDTLVIALPVDAADAALDALAGTRGPELVIDVASVKSLFVRHAGRVRNYVGTHPMAGRERGGIDAADAGLFAAATWAYTPHADRALVERVRAFIEAMGSRAVEIDAARHDDIVALTSHLPQALSVILGAELGAAADDRRVLDLCGPGIRSMLRLARSPQTVWSPIVAANAGPLSERLRSVAAALEIAAAALEAGDSEPLMSYFRLARDVTVALEQQSPSAPRSSSYRCP